MGSKPLPRPTEDWQITISPYEPPLEYPEIREERDIKMEEIQGAADEIRIPETLRGAHPLVVASLHALEHAERDWNGLLKRPKQGCLDVAVSKKSLHRALRVLDALLRAFEARGWRVRITEGESSQTVVELMDVSVPFRISETIATRREEKVPDSNLSGRYEFRHSAFTAKPVPAEALALHIEHGYPYYRKEEDGLRRTWADGKRQRLEECLPKFMAGVVKMAAAKREGKLREEEEKRRRIEEEERRQQAERHRAAMWEKIKAEQAQVDRLLGDAAHWEQSKLLRNYIQAVWEAAVARGETITDDSQLGVWLKWAAAQADRLDPLTPSPPSILDDKEKYRPPEPSRRWNDR